jgi:hypothetical protein
MNTINKAPSTWRLYMHGRIEHCQMWPPKDSQQRLLWRWTLCTPGGLRQDYTLCYISLNIVPHTADPLENVALDWRGVLVARNFSGPWDLLRGLNFCCGRAGCGAVAPTDDLGYSLQCLVPRDAPVAVCYVKVVVNSRLTVSVSFSTYHRLTEGGVQPPPPPKFRSFEKAEPNSQFRGIYIRNNLIRIRVLLICKLSGTPN